MEFNSYFSVNNEDMPQDLLKLMKKNSNDTVFVASKDDPRLKKYRDSLRLYNNNPSVNDLNNLLKQGTYIKTKKVIPGVTNQPIEMYSPNIEKIAEYNKIGKNYSYFPPSYESAKQKGYTKVNEEYFDNNGEKVIVSRGVYKKPVQPIKYEKRQGIVKEDTPSPLSLMKKPEIVVKKNNYEEGEDIMLPVPFGGGSSFIGVKKKDGNVEYVKPEDFKRMGVPAYAQEFILKQLAKNEK